MTKREVIWLLIRLAGLWFLWQSIENVIVLSSSYLQTSQNPELLSRSAAVFLQLIWQTGFHFVAGLYCLSGGNALFKLLSRERPDDGDSFSR